MMVLLIGNTFFVPITSINSSVLIDSDRTASEIEMDLPDVPFAGILVNETPMHGFLNQTEGEYWEIAIPQNGLRAVIDLKCGGNDFDLWLYRNERYFHGSTNPGDNHLLITRIQYLIGVWQIFVFPGENYIGPGAYNLTVTITMDPFVSGAFEGVPRRTAHYEYQFSSSHIYPESVIKTSNEDLIIASTIYTPLDTNHTEFERQLLLLKIDTNGQLLWNNTYGENQTGYYDICESPDGRFWVIGNTVGPVEYNYYGQVSVFCVDSDGELVWSRKFGYDGWRVNDITSCPDGTIVAVGGYSYKEDDNYYTIGWAMGLDKNGTQKWLLSTNDTDFKLHFPLDICNNTAIVSCESLSDGLVALGGNTYSVGWVGLINATRKLMWGVELSEKVKELQTIDENLLLVIGSDYIDGPYITLKHITFEGEIIRDAKIPHQIRFSNVVRHNGTGLVFMLTDWSTPIPSRPCLIFRTDLNGKILWSYHEFNSNWKYAECLVSFSNNEIAVVICFGDYPGLAVWVTVISDTPVTENTTSTTQTSTTSNQDLSVAIVGMVLIVLVLVIYWKRLAETKLST